MDSIRTADKPWTLVAFFASLTVVYFASRVVYRLYFHPLHHIPGPWINSISRIPYARHLLAGTTVDNVVALHDKYGEVVRLSPNEVSFISGETAWQDIYGFRTGKHKGHQNMPKDPAWYAPSAAAQHIILANDADHTRFRKVLSHSFSEKALREQEPLLQRYVDLLISKLGEVATREKTTQDMTVWYNWTTFDIIADLMFGEPFGNLETLKTHRYIDSLFQSLRAFTVYYVMYYWPFVKRLQNLVGTPKLIQQRKEYWAWVSERTRQRAERETQRADFMTEILKHNGDKGAELQVEEMGSNAVVFLTAGSETTATLLSAVTYLLLRNPAVLQKLNDEVRGRWSKYDQITIDEVNNTPYLIAVLQEALRYFPPVPTGFERKVPQGGEMISGHYIPGGTSVCVSSYPASHSQRNWTDPDAFVPERWLGDERYANDNRKSLEPFSFGPRNCLGKNLAYAEMRLILAKMVWSFDMRLDASCDDWMKRCKVKTLWEKPPLIVHVEAVVRG